MISNVEFKQQIVIVQIFDKHDDYGVITGISVYCSRSLQDNLQNEISRKMIKFSKTIQMNTE